MRTGLSITAIVLLGACDPPAEDPGLGFIAPLDGQTHVATNQDLLIRTGGLDIPENYAVPQSFIQVVDLEEGGFVDGEVVRDGDDIRFLPAEAWEPNTRYAWSITQIPVMARSPEVHIPAHLTGEAVFDTSPAVDILDIVIEGDRPCALFSRKIVAPNAEVLITIDDTIVDDVTFEVFSEDEWDGRYKRMKGDDGASVVCFDVHDLSGGESLRIWWNDGGPWSFTLDSGKVSKALQARRRSN